MKLLAGLKDSLLISKFKSHTHVEKLLLILVGEENEGQVTLLLENLLFMHDFHVGLVDSGLHHHHLNIVIGGIGLGLPSCIEL